MGSGVRDASAGSQLCGMLLNAACCMPASAGWGSDSGGRRRGGQIQAPAAGESTGASQPACWVGGSGGSGCTGARVRSQPQGVDRAGGGASSGSSSGGCTAAASAASAATGTDCAMAIAAAATGGLHASSHWLARAATGHAAAHAAAVPGRCRGPPHPGRGPLGALSLDGAPATAAAAAYGCRLAPALDASSAAAAAVGTTATHGSGRCVRGDGSGAQPAAAPVGRQASAASGASV